MHTAQIAFAYNNTLNDTTGLALFFVAYGQHPPTLFDAPCQALSVRDDDFNTATKYVRVGSSARCGRSAKGVTDANFTLTIRLNSSRRHVVYNIGDEVILSTRNLKLPSGSSRE
jgi:hypothetical protein